MSSVCSTVVEHSPRHPKVTGSIPATTNHAVGGGGCCKKMFIRVVKYFIKMISLGQVACIASYNTAVGIVKVTRD
jgi:hypothetical protein